MQTTDFFKPPFRQVGTRFLKLAAVFYAVLILAAAVLGVFTGRDVFALGDRLALNLFIGVIVASGTVISGLVIYWLVPVLRGLSNELAPHLVDGARRRDLVLVSILSGVGEEVFFRGALQPLVGLVVASLLFGALHVGPDRRYLVWTLWAVAAGFLFGALYLWTGGILAPVTAHVLHNVATLLLWKQSRRRAGSGVASDGSGGDPASEAARGDAAVRGQG